MNEKYLAIITFILQSADKQITLTEMVNLPCFDKLQDPKETARTIKSYMVKKGILQMKRRGVYTLNF